MMNLFDLSSYLRAHLKIQPGYSLGIVSEKSDGEIVSVEKDGILFFIDFDNLSYFQNYDLVVSYRKGTEEI